MTKWLAALLLCVFGALSVQAASGNYQRLLIDDFENRQALAKSAWEIFGGINVQVKEAPKTAADSLVLARKAGRNALSVQGKAKDWYVGGIRTRIKGNISPYSHLRIMLMGRPGNLAKVTVELQGREIYSYSIFVNWIGWKQLVIPLKKFKAKHRRAGTNRMSRPDWIKLVFLNDRKTGPISLAVDTIEFVKME